MAAFFFDLDGTLVKHGTFELLPGALEMLERLESEGHDIIITTRRGDREFPDHPVYGETPTRKWLLRSKIPHHQVVFDVVSPRVVVNDEHCSAFRHPANAEWDPGQDFNI